MPVNELTKESASDIMTAFSIVFVERRALEQQHNVMPDSIVQAIQLEMEEIPLWSRSPRNKNIVANIANTVNGNAFEVPGRRAHDNSARPNLSNCISLSCENGGS